MNSISNAEKSNQLHDYTVKLTDEIEKVIIGKHNEITMLLTALLSGGHVLIEDVPGVGKTTLASTISKAAGLDFKRIQFTPDVTASDITGFYIYNRKSESFEFREGMVMCNILLADEINRASPKTQSSLLEVMEEKSVTVDGNTYKVPSPFMVIATQNPTGFVGTFPLPEAQLDRFGMKLSMGYPSEDEEYRIVFSRIEENPYDNIKAVTNSDIINELRSEIKKIYVSQDIGKYIVSLISATRKDADISLGASPRATLSLTRTAQAYAYLKHHDYVTPEDIAAIFKYAIAHRIVIKQESRLGRLTSGDIINRILRSVEVPFKSSR